jgi:hypothetical protein
MAFSVFKSAWLRVIDNSRPFTLPLVLESVRFIFVGNVNCVQGRVSRARGGGGGTAFAAAIAIAESAVRV